MASSGFIEALGGNFETPINSKSLHANTLTRKGGHFYNEINSMEISEKNLIKKMIVTLAMQNPLIAECQFWSLDFSCLASF
jgi:hypothetical protein